MNQEVIKFETNIPQVVALAFTEGKEVESQFSGPQVMFSTVDGRRMYLAPFVAEKIKAAGVGARVPFEICRKQMGKAVEWQVRTHNEAATGAQTSQAKAPITNQGSIRKHTVTTPSAYDDSPARADNPVAARMMGALCAAVDAAMEAEMYGSRQGRDFEFGEESIRAIALTIFIQQGKGGAA